MSYFKFWDFEESLKTARMIANSQDLRYKIVKMK